MILGYAFNELHGGTLPNLFVLKAQALFVRTPTRQSRECVCCEMFYNEPFF